MLEFIRDGRRVAELMDLGRRLLGRRQVMDGVPDMVLEVQVEGTFPDGTKLVTVHHPIAADDGDLRLALYGSFLPVPDLSVFRPPDRRLRKTTFFPAHCDRADGRGGAERGPRDRDRSAVTNIGDRPIQVGSHYHFIETNAALRFDRGQAYGKRLDIPAGTAVRFEPGDTKTVAPGGHRGQPRHSRRQQSRGRTGERSGPPGGRCDASNEGRFQHESALPCHIASPATPTPHIYGPTTGDKVRLGDTSLVLEVEKDFAVYGDECKFGGGKTIREGMGQAAGVESGRCPRLRHHQRIDRRLHRNLQGRCRDQERVDFRNRQGGESRCDGRRYAGNDRGCDNGSHRRRRA